MNILRLVWGYRQALIASAVISFLAHTYYDWRIDRLKLDHETALKAKEAEGVENCKKDQAITQGVSHDYQQKLDDLGRKLADAKRLYSTRCIMPTARAASGRNEETGANLPAGSDAVAAESVIELAGEGEQYRLQLIACQRFITETWGAKGYDPVSMR